MWRFQAVAALLALPSAWAVGGSAVLFMLQDPKAGILHPPAKGLLDDSVMLEDVTEMHKRVMGHAPRATMQPLPHVDYFERPTGNLVFVVDGLSGGYHTTFVNQLHREHFACRVDGVAGMTDLASAYTGMGEDGERSTVPKRHVCVSGDASLRAQGVCGQGAVQVDPLTQALDMDMLHALDAEEVDHFQPLYEADGYFLAELQSILRLPTLFSGEEGEADTFLVFSNGLKKVEQRYGRNSQQFAAGRRALDKAMRLTVEAMSERRGRRLVAQIALTEPVSLGSGTRRGLAPAAVSAASKNVTMEDIASVNIITWTSVGLVLILLMVLSVLCNADSGPKDSLLYAKFQADVSGGKND